MISCPGCTEWIPDGSEVCPSCGRILGGGPEPGGGGVPPPPPTPSFTPPSPPEPPSQPDITAAVEKAGGKVKFIGLAFLLLGALGILGSISLWQFLWRGPITETELEALREGIKGSDPAMVKQALEVAREIFESRILGWLGVFQSLAYGFVLWAGLELRSLRARRAGIAAASLLIVLSLLGFNSITCLTLGCITHPIIGILALLVLTGPLMDSVFAPDRSRAA